jgi:hypothetical protein
MTGFSAVQKRPEKRHYAEKNTGTENILKKDPPKQSGSTES